MSSSTGGEEKAEWQTLEPAVPAELLRIARNHCDQSRPTYDLVLKEVPRYSIYYAHVNSWLKDALRTNSRLCIGNAFRFLGAADPKRAASDLRFYVERWSNAVADQSDHRSILEFNALTSAFHGMAIALRSGRLSSTEADFLLDYMADSADPKSWSARSITWSWVDEAGREMAFAGMAGAAIEAVALSGHPESRSRLEQIRANEDTMSLFRHPDIFYNLVDGWIDSLPPE